MDTKFLKEIAKSSAILLLAILAVIYTSTHMLNMSYEMLKTEFVSITTSQKSLSVTGYFFRDEIPIQNNTQSPFSPVVPDGKKVKQGELVAVTYNGEKEQTEHAIKLDNAITALITARENADTITKESVSSAIEAMLSEIMKNASLGKFPTGSENTEIALLTLIAEGKIITGEIQSTQFTNLLNYLKSERENIVQNLNTEDVNSPATGNYFENSDGMENVFNYNKINTMTPSEFANAISNYETSYNKSSNAGKIVDNYYIYFVAFTGIKDGSILRVGREYSVIINEKEINTILQRTVIDHAQNRIMLIFGTANAMQDMFINTRSAVAQIVTSSVIGYKIPSNAIRVVDGKTGVYIIGANLLYFREIVIVEEIDNYIIASPTDERNSLKNGELLVLSGKNLYNGKMIR